MAYINEDEFDVAIYKTFFDFVKLVLPNEKPFKRDSRFNAPKGPYCTIKIIETQPISWARGYLAKPTDETGLQDSFSTYKGVVSFSFYGEKAFSRAQAVANSFQFRQLKQVLRDNGIGYQRHTPVRDATRGIDGERMEQGATFSCSFFFVQGGSDTGASPSVIEEVTTKPSYNT